MAVPAPGTAPDLTPPPRLEGPRSEDWLAVWLGFVILALVAVGLPVRLPTFKWTTDREAWALAEAQRPALEDFRKAAVAARNRNMLFMAAVTAKTIEVHDRRAFAIAVRSLDSNIQKNPGDALERRATAIWKALRPVTDEVEGMVDRDNLGRVLVLGLAYLVLAAIGIALMGQPVG